jgi:hypothetical protein
MIRIWIGANTRGGAIRTEAKAISVSKEVLQL